MGWSAGFCRRSRLVVRGDGWVGVGEPEQLFKVIFDLPKRSPTWPPYATEGLWAERVGVDTVRLRNVPFYARGVAFRDTVRVRVDLEREKLVFVERVAESGYSTVRLIVDDAAVAVVEAVLDAADCWWEIDNTGLLWAVGVPPEVDYAALRQELLRLRVEAGIDLEEGVLGGGHRRSDVG